MIGVARDFRDHMAGVDFVLATEAIDDANALTRPHLYDQLGQAPSNTLQSCCQLYGISSIASAVARDQIIWFNLSMKIQHTRGKRSAPTCADRLPRRYLYHTLR